MNKIFLTITLMAFMAIGMQAQNNATLVKDIIDGTVGSQPYLGVVLNGILYFGANEYDPGFSPGCEIHRTDGTQNGTYLWREWNNNGASSGWGPYVIFNNYMYMTVFPGARPELWKSDGTTQGTTMVKAFSGDYGMWDYTISGNNLYFIYQMGSMQKGITDRQLWKTDGTSRGTVLVKDINSRGNDNVSRPMDVNGTLYFWADNGTNGLELWKSNGTSSGTVLVKDINQGSGSSYYNPALINSDKEANMRNMRHSTYIAVGNKLYFTATNGTNGFELWETDGTTAGTKMIPDICPNAGGSCPFGFVQWGDYIYFCAGNGDKDFELYRLKVINPPNPNYAQLVADINPTTTGTVKEKSSFPIWLTVYNNALYFSAYHPDYGRELWISDGIPGGTTANFKDINFGAGSSTPNDSADQTVGYIKLPRSFFEYNGWLYFSADDGTAGSELWKSDGTADNTTRIADINENAPGSFPKNYIVYNGAIFFNAATADMGQELWMYDPTNIKGPAVERLDAAGTNGISPNPANDYLNVQFQTDSEGDIGVSVWSICGKEMMNLTYPQRKSLNETIDISALPAGTYILNIRSGYNIERRKFIKL